MVPAGNKAKRLSSVNHTTITIHHHHHYHQATGEINKIAQQRIDQIVKSGGAEIERVAPKIIKGAIEEVYKTPFRLFGILGRRQFEKIKRRLFQ